MANLMYQAEDVTLTDAEGGSTPALLEQPTSKQVVRKRCAKCFSPVLAALGKARVVVPSSLFPPPHPEAWKPQHHLYYDRRTLECDDGLPKFRTHFGSDKWAGEPPEAGDK